MEMQLALRDHQSAETMNELRALNARFIHNFVTNDVASHDAILHPAFITILPTGQRWDRATYLKYWATAFDPDVIVYWDVRSLPSSATLRWCAPPTSTRAAAMEMK
jgi:hypothetical protein